MILKCALVRPRTVVLKYLEIGGIIVSLPLIALNAAQKSSLPQVCEYLVDNTVRISPIY
jgi:hypothetical protein